MKKVQIKSLFFGFLLGAIFTVIIVNYPNENKDLDSYALSQIESTTINNSKVYFYNKEIPLKNPLVSIKKADSKDSLLYIPMNEILEYMQFNVDIDHKENKISLTMNHHNNYQNMNNYNNYHNNHNTNNYCNNTYYKSIPSDISTEDADSQALDIMNNTGNWGYIEPLIPFMSKDGLQKTIDVYNSKHPDPSQHKILSDYKK
ncbi:MAG: hypothetical protein N4A54_02900 [Peptostreptococcaceae bacterium]|jgi:hypothetical protein|nr:hypothetical protein [Peptostreptococcaceae bacterium]